MAPSARATVLALLMAACGTSASTAPMSTAPSSTSPTTTSRPASAVVDADAAMGVIDCSGTPTTADPLAELDARIRAGDCGAITSLAVWHGSSLRFEAHYQETSSETRYPLFSVTKSVTSAMVGVAIADGLVGLDDPVLGYFPRYDQIDNLDARKEAITVDDLLTMRAGFAWEETAIDYGDSGNSATQMAGSGDWVKFTLDRPMASSPGTVFRYNTGASMLLSGIIQRSAGMPLDTYTAAHLFAPLGIPVTDWRWDGRSAGRVAGGSGLHLTTADMIAFGRLYLDMGMWEGEQVLPADWVEASTRPWVESVGLLRSPGLPAAGSTFDYGYHWWRFGDGHPVVAGLAANDVYFAWGLGGNFVFVVPHLDLVVATTAGNFDDGRCAVPAPACAETVIFAALRDYILSALP